MINATKAPDIKKAIEGVLGSLNEDEILQLDEDMGLTALAGAMAPLVVMAIPALYKSAVENGWFGLGSEKADLNVIPMGNDIDSWVMCSDGYLRHNKEEMHRITQLPQEGDTIVCLNSQELNLFLNIYSYYRELATITLN